jgi:hypothetical protein
MSVNDHDDGALDALMFLAFFDESARQMPKLTGPEPELAPDDQAALDALGPDLVMRVLSGQVKPKAQPDSSTISSAPGLRIATALNRGGEDGELTDAAREEMERKIKELEEGDGNPGVGK